MRLLVFLLLISFNSLASPQIYPSVVTYQGVGNLSATITLFGVEESTKVDLVYIKALTQAESKDIKLGSFLLSRNSSKNIPINLNVKTAKTFWVCVKEQNTTFPVRNCTKFKTKDKL